MGKLPQWRIDLEAGAKADETIEMLVPPGMTIPEVRCDGQEVQFMQIRNLLIIYPNKPEVPE